VKRGLVEPPRADHAERVRALRERLRAAGAQLGLVYGDVSRSDDIEYLTGLCIYWNEGVVGVPTDGEPALLSKLSKRVHPWMRRTSTLTDLRSGRDLAALIADYAGGARRIALVDRGLWPALLVRALEAACAPAELADLPGAVRDARLVPEAAELERLRELGGRRGAALDDAVGRPEREALAAVERTLRAGGALDVVAIRDEAPDGSVTLDVRVQQHGRWLRAARCAGGEDAARATAALDEAAARLRSGRTDGLTFTSHADLAPGAPARPAAATDGGLLVGEVAAGGAHAAATFLIGPGGAEALPLREDHARLG
jgi:hypothetical protein